MLRERYSDKLALETEEDMNEDWHFEELKTSAEQSTGPYTPRIITPDLLTSTV